MTSGLVNASFSLPEWPGLGKGSQFWFELSEAYKKKNEGLQSQDSVVYL